MCCIAQLVTGALEPVRLEDGQPLNGQLSIISLGLAYPSKKTVTKMLHIKIYL